MWVKRSELDGLKNKIEEMHQLLGNEREAGAYHKARFEGQQSLVSKMEGQIVVLTQEKKELLDELLIASGVKMSKYQEQVALKQLANEDVQPQYSGQTRQWAHDASAKTFGTSVANQRQMEIMEELERNAGLISMEDGG